MPDDDSLIGLRRDRPTPAPRAIVAAFADAVAPGGHLAISHATVADIYSPRVTSPVVLRSAEQIESLFAGHDLVEPGIVPFTDWRPDVSVDPQAQVPIRGLADVGRKRLTSAPDTGRQAEHAHP